MISADTLESWCCWEENTWRKREISFPLLLMIMLHLQFSCKSSFVFLSEFNCISKSSGLSSPWSLAKEKLLKASNKISSNHMFFNPSKATPLPLQHLTHLVPVLCSRKSESEALLACHVCQCVDSMRCAYTCSLRTGPFIGKRGIIFYQTSSSHPSASN